MGLLAAADGGEAVAVGAGGSGAGEAAVAPGLALGVERRRRGSGLAGGHRGALGEGAFTLLAAGGVGEQLGLEGGGLWVFDGWPSYG